MITAEVKPLPVSTKKEDQDLLYRELELQMQRLGHLVPFREELNWENEIGTVEIGSETIITKLKKAAAKVTVCFCYTQS